MTTLAGSMMRYRADIDGLRAVAVVAIVLYHADASFLPGGFAGVDIFFVISGYLITLLLTREFEATGQISFGKFYARRIRRLVPALALTIVSTLAAVSVFLSPIELVRVAKTAAAAALFASNFYFIARSADYFSPNSQHDPLLHTWSLGVEEQFYILWPLLLLVVYRSIGRRGFFLFCAAVVISSWAGSLMLNSNQAFYGSPTRAWEFAVGGLCSLVGFRVPTVVSAVLGAAGLLAITGYAALAKAGVSHSTIIPVLGAAAVLFAGNAEGSYVSRALGSWPLRMVGRVSYSWYLWHWPILVIVQQSIEAWLPPSTRLWCVAASFGAAVVSYLLVERPIRESRSLVGRSAVSIGLGAAATIVVVALSAMGAWWATETVASNPRYHALWMTAAEPRPCIQWQNSELLECSYGNLDAGINVMLVGDSLAAEWAPVLATIAEQQKWRLTTLLMGECPVAEIYPSVSEECRDWRVRAIARIAERRPSLVITSFSRLYRLWAGGDRFDAALSDVLSRISGLRIPIAVIAPTPMGGVDALSCMMRPQWLLDERRCDSQRRYVLDDGLSSSLKAIAANIPGVQVWDFSDEFCDNMDCPAFKSGTLVYSDASHASIAFLRTLKPQLEPKLRAILRAGG